MGGNGVDSGDGLFYSGLSESWWDGYRGVGCTGDVSRGVYGDKGTRRVDVGVEVVGVGIHGITGVWVRKLWAKERSAIGVARCTSGIPRDDGGMRKRSLNFTGRRAQ